LKNHGKLLDDNIAKISNVTFGKWTINKHEIVVLIGLHSQWGRAKSDSRHINWFCYESRASYFIGTALLEDVNWNWCCLEN